MTLVLIAVCLPNYAMALQMQYTTNSDWGAGFGGSVILLNDGDTAINDWTLEFDFSHSIDQIWGAQVLSHTSDHYVLQPSDWNRSIAAGSSISFGFNGSPGNVIFNTPKAGREARLGGICGLCRSGPCVSRGACTSRIEKVNK